MTHICISKLTIIASDNGLSPGRRQAIIWTNAGILLIRLLGTNFNEMLIEIVTFSFMKMCLKVSSAIWRQFCLGLNVLMGWDMQELIITSYFFKWLAINITGDPLHSRAACTQPCNVNTHSRAHCSPGARLCEQWGHGCVNNGARLCASARLCRGSPVNMAVTNIDTKVIYCFLHTRIPIDPFHRCGHS